MDLNYLFDSLRQFFITHHIAAAAVFVGLALFLWRKPGQFFKCATIVLALLAGTYVFTQLTQSAQFGSVKKHDITTEREKNLFEK